MKKSQIKSIHTPPSNETEPPEEELKFIKVISRESGHIVAESDQPVSEGKSIINYQPDDYGNVAHLTGNIYLAWDEGNTEFATLYVGVWMMSEPTRPFSSSDKESGTTS